MRWWTRRGTTTGPVLAGVLVVAVLFLAPALAPAAGAQVTGEAPPESTTSTAPTTTGATTSTTAAPAQAEGQQSTSSAPDSRAPDTSTTTTTVPALASGTWITAPGYNPDWHSINPPWVLRPPAGSGVGRRIVYSKYQQRVWLMEDNGYITNTHLISGRYDIPAFGLYHVYSKSLSTFATHNPSITWHYMVRFAVGPQGGGIGLHEIPTQYGQPVQTVEQLGQPLSGGCLRQSHDDAIFVWNWTPIGTPVVVVP